MEGQSMNEEKNKHIDISVVVTITDDAEGIEQVYEAFSQKLAGMNKTFEFIFVQQVENESMWSCLQELYKKYSDIRVIRLRSVFGESVALSAGFEQARGDYILTLPIYFQISPADIDKILLPLGKEYDLVTAWRYPRADSLLNRVESKIFNWLVCRITGIQVHDLGCGVTGMSREVALSLDIYGDLFRFLPILAYRLGYRIGEVKVSHCKRLKKSGVYGVGVYVRRLLDILTLFFIVKFTKKPLRFFGLLGFGCFGLGFISGLWLTAIKLLTNKPIADRPLLILAVLLIVLGIQLLSIGLIGEIIIFTHAKKIKEYNIEKILE